jgi:pimeloyl-ACP methyl ester carboxylesterase
MNPKVLVRVELNQGEVTLRGITVGTGPPVLLLHAGRERRQVWNDVIAVIADAGYSCVAFDQRGHGASGKAGADHLPNFAADVAAMLQGLPGAVVAGCSLGGLAALLAAADPAVQRGLAGLVLIDVVPDPDPARARAFLAAAGIALNGGGLVEDILARAQALRRAAACIEIPTLLVRGGLASPLVDGDIERFRALVPHAATLTVPNAGHLVARDAPNDLARLILNFLDDPAVRGRRSGASHQSAIDD